MTSNSSKFTAACRKPHRLLWFQHNGWSFRPCKMLYENSEGYEVICFGGRHEREFVPRSRAFNMTFTAPDLGLRMTPSLKKALDEAEEYKANQAAYDRNLPLALKDSPTDIAFARFNKFSPWNQDSAADFSSASVGNKRGNRKRKAGPKYSCAFGSTDTESSHSNFSVTKSKMYKRRKNSQSPSVNSTASVFNKNARNSDGTGVFIKKFADDTSALSSLSSESDDDDSSLFRLSDRHKGHISSIANKTSTSNASNSLYVVKNENERSIHSGASTCSVKSSKPVIRIKPLPPRCDSQPVDSVNLDGIAKSKIIFTTKVDSDISGSSTSSALTCSSSATIPAVLSVDDMVSGDSLFSEYSLTSQKLRIRKIGRPPKRRSKLREKKTDVTLTSKTEDSKENNAINLSTEASVSNMNVNRPERSLKTKLSVRPLSPLSSLSDCDSESSSSSSRSQSPSSSSLSSSSLSSSSSSSSPSHSTNPAHPRKNNSAFPNDRLSKSSSKPEIPINPPPKPVESEHGGSSIAFSGSLYKNSHKSGGSKLQRTSQSPTDLSSSNGPPKETERSVKSSKKKSQDAGTKSSEGWGISPNQIPTSATSGSSLQGTKSTAGGFTKSVSSIGWSSLNRAPTTFGNQTHTGPTPPTNSASSSCYSSVSPAALSTTSGLGSSVSDPKSVDASPAEVAAMLGTTSFSCSVSTTTVQSTTAQSDAAYKAVEEQIHRIYSEQLASLTTERDQAREELTRRDSLIAKMREDHEAELKRVKQMSWCKVCLAQAFYHCCVGTSYCSEKCQLRHWTDQHIRECRRKGDSQQQPQQQKR